MPIFVEVILPLALPKHYTYSVPTDIEQEVKVGARVVVQFGRRKLYSAIVARVHGQAPTEYQTKDILQLIDDSPLASPMQIEFWNWMASYYMCTDGEVMKAALPSGLKLESEAQLSLNEDQHQFEDFTETEAEIIDLLNANPQVSISQLASKTRVKNPMNAIKSLLDRQIISIFERIEPIYKPKIEVYVRIHSRLKTETDINEVFEGLVRAVAQQKLLMAFLALTAPTQSTFTQWLPRRELLEKANVAASVLKALADKDILETESRIVSRLDSESESNNHTFELSSAQEDALKAIEESFSTKNVVLLHGVTSSGKTEIYIKLIAQQLEAGKQVLYLLPEIALTAQIINRLKRFFGSRVGVYHSKFSDSQRVEVYQSLLSDGKSSEHPSYDVILGVRSSIFLPFSRLGLIIVDEEHENSYKQSNPAPRYNARDCAIVMGSMCNAKVLLGTATPSVESYYNAKGGKYGYVSLLQRYMGVNMPQILIANTREARKQKRMKSVFTPDLIGAITNALERKEQVILFQNRRGYAPFIECEECGWIATCKHCAVSLTYHMKSNQMVCHYCGYSIQPLSQCPACASGKLSSMGFGTERIEDELAILFPGAAIERMDLDTTRSRRSYERIISDFEQGSIDILVGTQMITKGLDFDKVNLVGVLNADNMLNFPDFRAHERSFQLMAQVSGRAGRRQGQGLVIIQTNSPQHSIIQQVVANDYEGMFADQIQERRVLFYPPFTRIITLSLKYPNEKRLKFAAHELAKALRKHFGKRVLGPEAPTINRVQNHFIENILIKLERTIPLPKAKELILHSIDQFKSYKPFSPIILSPDVDPM